MTTYFVVFPRHFEDEGDDHPTLPSAHPHGYVAVEAKDEVKARKYALDTLGAHWATIYEQGDFDPGYFPMGCLAKIRKAEGRVQMDVLK